MYILNRTEPQTNLSLFEVIEVSDQFIALFLIFVRMK